MILGIGVDIEHIERFKRVSEKFLNLVFSEREIQYCKNKKEPFISFAGKFCAKEAIIKAYNKEIPIKDIEILNRNGEGIKIYMNKKYKKNIHCSISHTNKIAIAFAIMEK